MSLLTYNGHTLATRRESCEQHCVSAAPRRCTIASSCRPPPTLPRCGCMPGPQASTIQCQRQWCTLRPANRLITSEDQDIATTVITAEEQMQGWLAWINRSDDVH